MPDRLWLDFVLERRAGLFTPESAAVLSHDDLHHGNLLFQRANGTWSLTAVLDWDKAWAGPRESDLARVAFWDDMTGPGFWEVYRAAMPIREGEHERALVHQLLWCLEYDSDTVRHRRDTARLLQRLGQDGIQDLDSGLE